MTDPINSAAILLAQDLIRCPSVTPLEAGALDLLQKRFEAIGFICRRYPFGRGPARVDNLYARLGTGRPNLCFAGHTDVVPVGARDKWKEDPFGGAIKDGELWGRGAADMKGSIAAFVVAVEDLISLGWQAKGSVSFLITGDEEGPAINGTDKLLKAITKDGEVIDHCLVGEPTNPNHLGEMIKSGRRGSLNGHIEITGQQGHVAYPHRASNPVPALLDILNRLQARILDNGNESFQPSNLEITSIDVGNPAHNVIPDKAEAQFNIRFNTEHSGAALKRWIGKEIQAVEKDFDGTIATKLRATGEAFLTEPSFFTDLIQAAILEHTGRMPELSTSGGTSDARYIVNYAPVVEFGLVGATIHQVNERVSVDDIEVLRDIYMSIIQRYFA